MSTLLERARSARDSLESQEKALAALVAELERRSVAWRRDGELLRLSNASGLPAALLEAVKRHKPELLAIADRRIPPAPPARTIAVFGRSAQLVAVEGGIVGYRTPDGIDGACVAWCASENGIPLGVRTEPDRSHWTADPRSDLVEDSDLWRAILAGLYDLTGLDAEDGLGEPVMSAFMAWRNARGLGARLSVADEGHLDVSAEDAVDQSEIDGLLRSHHRRLQTVLPGIVRGWKGAA